MASKQQAAEESVINERTGFPYSWPADLRTVSRLLTLGQDG
mgnify:CR=1 FL=1